MPDPKPPIPTPPKPGQPRPDDGGDQPPKGGHGGGISR